MSSGDKDRIADYSADYRNAHPQKPKAENSRSRQGKQNRPAENKQKAQNRPQQKPKTVHTELKRPVPPPAVPDRMDNDSEIDDFLPAKDQIDGEQILTKWNDDTEKTPAPKEIVHRRSGKYRYGIFAGSLVLILALIGVVFIATQVGTRIHGALTDDSRQRAYDKFLTVAVAQDPQPFESPEKADPDFVLNASLWKTMTENGTNYTSYDDAGRIIVPLGDVADSCRKLFGSKCSLQPKNPATDTFYTYDSTNSQFHISLYSLEGTYEPYTESIKKDGDSTILRVGYVAPTDPTRKQSGVSSGSAKPTPTKYMDYVLKTDETTKKEYIFAVRKAGA